MDGLLSKIQLYSYLLPTVKVGNWIMGYTTFRVKNKQINKQ